MATQSPPSTTGDTARVIFFRVGDNQPLARCVGNLRRVYRPDNSQYIGGNLDSDSP